eukprot:8522243-Pyramimonas_sp.AAC.1
MSVKNVLRHEMSYGTLRNFTELYGTTDCGTGVPGVCSNWLTKSWSSERVHVYTPDFLFSSPRRDTLHTSPW